MRLARITSGGRSAGGVIAPLEMFEPARKSDAQRSRAPFVARLRGGQPHLKVESPKIVDADWRKAYETAVAQRAPMLVALSAYADDRGWSLMNLLSGVMSERGQINFSVQYPGVIKAWHRHLHQTDFWMCVHGHIKAGVHREDDGRSWAVVIGEMRPAVLIIPPTLWHGAATVGPTPAGLLYYVTNPYNPDEPDEQRAPYDRFEGFPWTVQHR